MLNLEILKKEVISSLKSIREEIIKSGVIKYEKEHKKYNNEKLSQYSVTTFLHWMESVLTEMDKTDTTKIKKITKKEISDIVDDKEYYIKKREIILKFYPLYDYLTAEKDDKKAEWDYPSYWIMQETTHSKNANDFLIKNIIEHLDVTYVRWSDELSGFPRILN
jgi:hypothetical protein